MFHEELFCNLMAWMAHWHFVRVVSQRKLKSELGKIAVLVDECTKLVVKTEFVWWCEEHDIIWHVVACVGKQKMVVVVT